MQVDMDCMIERHKVDLYSLCYKLTNNKDEAEDLFQETWYKFFKNIDKLDDKKSIENWIYTICINTYRDNYSKKKRWLGILKDFFTDEEKEYSMENAPDEVTVDDEVIKKCDKKVVLELINKLDIKYKIPIILYYFKDYSYLEISSIMDLSLGTLKFRLNMAKKKLKKELEDLNYEM